MKLLGNALLGKAMVGEVLLGYKQSVIDATAVEDRNTVTWVAATKTADVSLKLDEVVAMMTA